MYLVLTALLAMNVSSTVLDKFVFINSSLEKSNGGRSDRNARTIEGMKSAVKEKGDRPDDMKVVKQAEKIRTETLSVLANLEAYKEEFIVETGGYLDPAVEDKRFIKGKENYDKVGHYMMSEEEGGQGHGLVMKKTLNDYTAMLKSVLKSLGANEKKLAEFQNLAKDADEDDFYSKDPNQKGKKWAQLAFDGTPTHAGMATVSEFQANVLAYEAAALEFLVQQVGLKDITFDKIRPVIMPESKYVAAGTKYKADMFIAASPPANLMNQTTMTYNGEKAPVVGGVGKVEFTVTPGKYDKEGNARKTILASISLPQGGGNDTTFMDTIEYFVVRPVMQIQSQSVNALYYNCGNKLDVQVPALGTQYNPTFTASGGDAIAGATKGQVTLVPKSKKLVMTVSSNGNKIDSKEFAVRTIPAPEIKVYTSRGEVNLAEGIDYNTPELYLKAIPDPSFAQFLPDDAKFKIAEAEVTLVSGGLGRGSQRTGERINLRGMKGRKGSQISIEIKRVQRQNFRKQVEDFKKFQRFINISLK